MPMEAKELFEKIESNNNRFSVVDPKKPEKKEEAKTVETNPVSGETKAPEVTAETNPESGQKPPEGQTENPPEKKDSEKLEEANWQKRLHDSQAKITELAQRNSNYKKILLKYPKLLKYDEEGNPLDWDTDLIPPENKDNIIKLPTSEDLFDKPEEAIQNIVNFSKAEALKEFEAKQAAKEQQNKKVLFEKTFTKARQESFKKASEEYPEIAKENSEFRIKCEELYQNNPFYKTLPDADYIIALRVAAEMGVVPKSVTSKKSQEPPKQSNLMGLGNATTQGTVKENTSKLPTKIEAYFNDSKRFQAQD
jgi:hypothetical protein